MPVEWKDLEDHCVDLSENLEKVGGKECAYRAASNRIYYTAFHCAQDLAGDIAWLPPAAPGPVHKALIDRFSGCDAMAIADHSADLYNAVRKLAVQLNALRGKRVQADYHLDDKFEESDFKLAYEDYKRYRSQVDYVRDLLDNKAAHSSH